MKRIPLAVATALLAAAGCETADPPAAPRTDILSPRDTNRDTKSTPPGFEPPAPGTIVILRDEAGTQETSRVLDSDGYAVSMLRGGERVTEVPFCFRCAPDEDEIETERYATIWPLEVGKSATFRRRTAGGAVWVHEVSVTGEETVTTDFGPVETLVVEETVTGGDGGRATRRQWYSPQLGWSVRSEWRSPDDAGGWRLAAIALPR